MPKVIIQNWEESERGWGTRPDGFTIHLNREQHKQFVAWYYKTYNNANIVPDEYTRTDGDPFEAECDIKIYNLLAQYALSLKLGERDGIWGAGNYFTKGRELTLKDLSTIPEVKAFLKS